MSKTLQGHRKVVAHAGDVLHDSDLTTVVRSLSWSTSPADHYCSVDSVLCSVL